MLFYITVGAPQAVPGTACVEANRTACTEVYCSSAAQSRNRDEPLQPPPPWAHDSVSGYKAWSPRTPHPLLTTAIVIGQ
jgi:hypothetical protein